jgi:hypothetical protein
MRIRQGETSALWIRAGDLPKAWSTYRERRPAGGPSVEKSPFGVCWNAAAFAPEASPRSMVQQNAMNRYERIVDTFV